MAVGSATVVGGATAGGVRAGEGTADAGRTVALSTGIPGPTPAFLITTFAPNQATQTAMTVPAAQAVRPTMNRAISAIYAASDPSDTYGSGYGPRAHCRR